MAPLDFLFIFSGFFSVTWLQLYFIVLNYNSNNVFLEFENFTEVFMVCCEIEQILDQSSSTPASTQSSTWTKFDTNCKVPSFWTLILTFQSFPFKHSCWFCISSLAFYWWPPLPHPKLKNPGGRTCRWGKKGDCKRSGKGIRVKNEYNIWNSTCSLWSQA